MRAGIDAVSAGRVIDRALADADLESVQTLGDIYRSDIGSFKTAITRLFEETLKAWHQEKSLTIASETVGSLYRKRLGLSDPSVTAQSFKDRVRALVQQIPAIDPKRSVKVDPSTLTMRIEGRTLDFSGTARLLFQTTGATDSPTINTPGTLSGENILCDAEGRAWLTDFADAGRAEALWNYTALEALIRFDWVAETNLRRLFEFETGLQDDTLFQRPSQDVEPGLKKPAGAIQAVRKLAARAMGSDRLPYHLGIYFHAARRFADFDPAHALTPHELARLVHALVAMEMIAAKVAETDPTLRVLETARESGIRVDEESRAVYRDGKRVVLRGQSYELLIFLYKNANKVCRREDIVKQVFKTTYDAREDNRLNTAIRRIREKIEDDPDHPRYLQTDPAGGYKLVTQPTE